MQGSEAHDQLLGQVFGYAAIIRSEQQIDANSAAQCADGLTSIASKKSFLRELAANVLLELTGLCLLAMVRTSACCANSSATVGNT